ncbi:helix-turn-helix domain-containing protein [Vallitalea guaymasensis]|uniref:helix-turn-helix domain-containing protein n=1 Tax=Vallitalea guaymasensis TaxID=1185412 RepID=UPI002356988C|nr:helix-turn-helix transcriptional regulator [Vallitalea guaymasensis]
MTKKTNNNIFGTTIFNLRKERKVSQEELGMYVGVNKSTISKYERGVIVPTLDIAKKAAEFFGVTVEYLINPEQASLSNVIDNNNCTELLGLPKKYIQSIKLAYSNSITPDELIDLITVIATIKNGK